MTVDICFILPRADKECAKRFTANISLRDGFLVWNILQSRGNAAAKLELHHGRFIYVSMSAYSHIVKRFLPVFLVSEYFTL